MPLTNTSKARGLLGSGSCLIFDVFYFQGNIMIKEKLNLTKQILEDFPETRKDGNGNFLNQIYITLYKNEPINFNTFNAESYARARRKVLELHPELDERTKHTNNAECQVKREVA